MPKRIANQPPALEWLRECFNFADDGTVTLKKRAYKNDDRPIGSVIGSPNTKKDPRLRAMFQGQDHLLSRIVFYEKYEQWPDYIDHVDRNPLNNTPENLRAATMQTNAQNRSKLRTVKGQLVSSELKGAFWHRIHQKWQSQITDPNGKKVHLGTFETEEDAHKAYRVAATKMYGAFACLDKRHKK